MPLQQATSARGRGRRPLEQVRAEVLDAAAELLVSEGFAGFTIEKVAARSGASRVTLYKYWPSRGALALDAYLHQTGDRIAFRDTGDIGADLATVLLGFTELMRIPAQHRAFTQLVGAAQSDAELALAFDSHYFGPRRIEAVNLLQAAIDRGQIRGDTDPATVVDLLWGACYQRLLLPNLSGTLTDDFIRTLVATVMRGIAA